MSKWEGLDRRKFPRVSFPCLVVIGDDGKKGVILTHTENLGIGGVCVILKEDIKLFSGVRLELDLLDMQPHIKCKGKVVWNVKRKMDQKKKPLFFDIGVEFQDMSSSDLKRLEQIVKKIERKHGVVS